MSDEQNAKTLEKVNDASNSHKFSTVDHELGQKPTCLAEEKNNVNENAAGSHGITVDHPTSYLESLMHLFKGNIGPGLFAMGDAFRNAGIITAPLLTFFIAVISVHCQHMLLNCSKKMQDVAKCESFPDYAETVELCFANGTPKLRRWSSHMKTAVNIFICVTQLGFCCIYFVFISKNIEHILTYYGYPLDDRYIMALIFIPILLPSLITNLKYLAPVSMVANICMIISLSITMYYAFEGGVPSPKVRNYFTSWDKLALYFGTAIFAFEGIALVLPLKNAMKNPTKFDRPLGVLNVGMTAVSTLFIFAGFFGYLKWGESVGASLTLNLDVNNWPAKVVKIAVSLGVLLGYPLQLFVAIQIMWPSLVLMLKLKKDTTYSEIVFRTIMVSVTFILAELIPKLGLFISLIGALCSTALALVFPPVIEMVVSLGNSKGPGGLVLFKNIVILIVALVGFSTGTYESISNIIAGI